MLLQVQRNNTNSHMNTPFCFQCYIVTLEFESIWISHLVVTTQVFSVNLTAGVNYLTGTTELLDPYQTDPTDLDREELRSHFGNNTETQNVNALGQSEIRESEAA